MTHGAEARLEILRRDAERKIVEPLRRHKWDAKIEREARAERPRSSYCIDLLLKYRQRHLQGGGDTG
jgi:hypothetical protein